MQWGGQEGMSRGVYTVGRQRQQQQWDSLGYAGLCSGTRWVSAAVMYTIHVQLMLTKTNAGRALMVGVPPLSRCRRCH